MIVFFLFFFLFLFSLLFIITLHDEEELANERPVGFCRSGELYRSIRRLSSCNSCNRGRLSLNDSFPINSIEADPLDPRRERVPSFVFFFLLLGIRRIHLAALFKKYNRYIGRH